MKRTACILTALLLALLLIFTSACAGAKSEDAPPKYVFLFIGDGMSLPQLTAYANYMGTVEFDFTGTLAAPTADNQPVPLFPSFTRFPVTGMAATQDASKFITDSASAATAIASGVKALDGTLGVDAFGNPRPSIAELLREQTDYKIGIVSSVSIDHATPAAFYAHMMERVSYYDIALNLVESGFDYFGGGGFKQPHGAAGDMPGILELMADAGYTVADTYEAIAALGANEGKVIAVAPELDNDFGDAALQYAIDISDGGRDLRLADFVRTGIDVLGDETGFFMMVEGGKIDWACHANDAATAIWELAEFEAAVTAALEFYEKYPDETLIIVTGDHETGGLSNGFNLTAYDTQLSVLSNQRISFMKFMSDYIFPWREAQTAFEDAMTDVEALFGLTVLTERELAVLRRAYELSMIPYAERDSRSEEYLTEYSMLAYEPFQLAVTRILANKAGLDWTSTVHTALPVPVFAAGAGAERFAGFYDNTDIFHKLAFLLGLD
ncbi:MAG: alkaline phosphatase [Oscillospiraceae bacterium]|nr:alkaline phosphatase [Oscillospiraceae bacterium]